MPTLTTTLTQSYNQHASQLNGKRVWLACSGGRDSMALAHLTHQLYLQGKLPFCPQLLHVNHGLQKANDSWAQQVKQWAVIHNLPCSILHANVQGEDEQSARNARYQIMAEMMGQNDVLMLAHHADDQAETMLMRLFNGAGVTGLAGMKPWASKTIQCQQTTQQASNQHQLQQPSKTINLWRPWLTVSRAQITAYAQTNDLPYIDDPTNLMGNNKRSWLRSQLMPMITEQYPQAMANINRSGGLLAQADEVLAEQADSLLNQVQNLELSKPPYQQVLDIEPLLQLSDAKQHLLIHKWLQGGVQEEPLPPNKQRVDDIIALAKRCDNDHQTQIEWQGTHHYTICRYRGQLYRLRADWLAWLKLPIDEQVIQQQEIKEQEVKEQGIDKLTIKDDGSISWQVSLAEIAKWSGADFTNSQLTIKALKRTDKLTLQGRTVAKSGKKLLQELAVPVWERDSLVLVFCDDVPVRLESPIRSWKI